MLGRLSRILVVDEGEASRTVTHQCLLKLGYGMIDHVADSRSALTLMNQRSYAIVVSDWETPMVRGADLLRHARIEPHWRRLPFLMVIGAWQRKFIEIVRNDGAVLYLTRPFTSDILGARMAEVDRDAARLATPAPAMTSKKPAVTSDLWRSLRPDAFEA